MVSLTASMPHARSNDILACGCQAEATVFYPPGAGHLIADFFYVLASAPDNQHLQTIFFIEMDMGSRNDGLVMPMLQARKEIGKLMGMTIVDEGNGADGFLGRRFPFRLYQAVADQVADGLGTVCIALVGDELVKLA